MNLATLKSLTQRLMQKVMQRNADDPGRQWDVVCAMARMWKTAENKAGQALVTYWPRK
jgi:hypothetical protein